MYTEFKRKFAKKGSSMKNIEEKKIISERAVLVGLSSPILPEEDNSDYETLDELEELLTTAGGICVGKVLQRRDTPDSSTFIGEGKVQEVLQLALDNEADLIIFDNDIFPSQIKNLEKLFSMPVLDRTALILDIFSQRAHTSEGRLQVELAQYRYILTKLSGIGKSLSRLGGGIGTRGPGETKLETDRRHIRSHIGKLEQEFEKIRKVRGVQREQRIKSEISTAAIVGYTNAGKSTLLNALTGSEIAANNRLFDTLDPTARKLKVDDNFSVVFTDTVGFIRKLPHKLVEAFKATLEELEYADVILHVIDISNPLWEVQAMVVEKLMSDLGVSETPCIRVYNKADVAEETPYLREGDVLISAKDGRNLDLLVASIRKIVTEEKEHIRVEIPYHLASTLDLLYKESQVVKIDYLDEHISAEIYAQKSLLNKLEGMSFQKLGGTADA